MSTQFGGSIGGPIVKDRLFFFGSFSPRINVRNNKYQFASGTDPGEIERTSKFVQAFGKVSAGSRRVNAYVSVLATPTYVTGTLGAYNGFGPNWISSTKAGNAANIDRGWEQMQANVTGNVDVVITNGCTEAVALSLLATTRAGDTVAVESPTNFTFLQLLKELGLLVPKVINIERRGGERRAMRGVWIVDAQRYRGVDDARAAELFRSGYVAWIEAHLISLGSLSRLVARLDTQIKVSDESGPLPAATPAA